MVISDVIPAIAWLQSHYSFNVKVFLPEEFCQRLKIPADILECSNIPASDKFFDWIPYK